MIKGRKISIFQYFFSLIVRRLVRKNFNRCYLYKEDNQVPDVPMLFVANHSSWWDGLISFMLDYSHLKKDMYYMMSLEGMRSFPYFRYLGAFTVEKGNPRHILTSINYSIQLLKNKKSVWLFPQGEEYHLEKRPLGLQSGVIKISEEAKCSIGLVTYYYSFGHHKKPDVYIRITFIEELKGSNRKEKLTYLEEKLTEQLDGLKEDVVNEQVEKFTVLYL